MDPHREHTAPHTTQQGSSLDECLPPPVVGGELPLVTNPVSVRPVPATARQPSLPTTHSHREGNTTTSTGHMPTLNPQLLLKRRTGAPPTVSASSSGLDDRMTTNRHPAFQRPGAAWSRYDGEPHAEPVCVPTLRSSQTVLRNNVLSYRIHVRHLPPVPSIVLGW